MILRLELCLSVEEECRLRRVRSEWRALLDRLILAEVIPVPASSFANSLFLELCFARSEDAAVLDEFAGLIGRVAFYWDT